MAPNNRKTRKEKKIVEKPVEKVESEDEVMESEDQASEENDSSEEDLEMDEADIEDMSEDDEDEEDENDEFDDLELKKTAKTPKKYSSEAFSDAMTKILASSLTGTDKKQPILARSKGVERKIEDEKLDYKARKILSAQKKAEKEKGRVIPDYTTFDYEKKLRKVATRGVVKLFNAIRTQQKVTDVAVYDAKNKSKAYSAADKAKDVSTMSKTNFLDLLKTGKQ